MEYSLRQLVSGSTGAVALSEQEYSAIASALEQLAELYYIEEKLDMAMENYCEFESELLRISLRSCLFNEITYPLVQDARVLVSRRFANLLSSCRTYLDHSEHHLSSALDGDARITAEYKQLKSQMYDEHFGYRLLEAMRNFAQHRHHALSKITFSGQVVERAAGRMSMYRTVPEIVVADLEGDAKFKAAVLKELKAIGPTVSLRPYLMDYMTDLLELNAWIRRETYELASSRERLIRDSIARYTRETHESAEIVVLCKSGVGQGCSETHNLFVDVLDRKAELVRKNSTAGELRDRFVSNEL